MWGPWYLSGEVGPLSIFPSMRGPRYLYDEMHLFTNAYFVFLDQHLFYSIDSGSLLFRKVKSKKKLFPQKIQSISNYCASNKLELPICYWTLEVLKLKEKVKNVNIQEIQKKLKFSIKLNHIR